MLGDKAVLTVMDGPRSTATLECEVKVSGGSVVLDTTQPGIVSAIVLDRKMRERDRMVVATHALVMARLEYRK